MRITLIPVAVMLCWMVAVSGGADTEQPKVLLGPRAKSLRVGPGMDASGLDLEGTVIVGQDLTNATFDNAKLRGARISDCDLFDSSFRGVDLRGSEISDCRIAGADFTDALINGIIGANALPGQIALVLPRTQLEKTASYRRKDLSTCGIGRLGEKHSFDFRGFDLRDSSLSGDFSRSKFSGARIHMAKFTGVFPFDELRKTQDFKSGTVSGDFSCHESLDLSDVFLRDSTINIRDSRGFTLEGATLYRCRVYFRGSSASLILPTTRSYQDGTLAHNTFLDSDMSDLNLDRINLTNCTFDRCDLARATFNDAVVSRADFREAKGLAVDQIRSTWNFKNNRMSDVLLPAGLMSSLSATARENTEPVPEKWTETGDGSPFSMGTPFVEFDFSGQNLTGCVVWGPFTDAVFTDAVVTGADLNHNWHGQTAKQVRSTWNCKHGRMKDVRIPEELRRELNLPR